MTNKYYFAKINSDIRTAIGVKLLDHIVDQAKALELIFKTSEPVDNASYVSQVDDAALDALKEYYEDRFKSLQPEEDIENSSSHNPPNPNNLQLRTVTVPTRYEVNRLKDDWIQDPIWDIEDTDGFWFYREELKLFREKQERIWAEKAHRKLADVQKEYGVNSKLAGRLLDIDRMFDLIWDSIEKIKFNE